MALRAAPEIDDCSAKVLVPATSWADSLSQHDIAGQRLALPCAGTSYCAGSSSQPGVLSVTLQQAAADADTGAAPATDALVHFSNVTSPGTPCNATDFVSAGPICMPASWSAAGPRCAQKLLSVTPEVQAAFPTFAMSWVQRSQWSSAQANISTTLSQVQSVCLQPGAAPTLWGGPSLQDLSPGWRAWLWRLECTAELLAGAADAVNGTLQAWQPRTQLGNVLPRELDVAGSEFQIELIAATTSASMPEVTLDGRPCTGVQVNETAGMHGRVLVTCTAPPGIGPAPVLIARRSPSEAPAVAQDTAVVTYAALELSSIAGIRVSDGSAVRPGEPVVVIAQHVPTLPRDTQPLACRFTVDDQQPVTVSALPLNSSALECAVPQMSPNSVVVLEITNDGVRWSGFFRVDMASIVWGSGHSGHTPLHYAAGAVPARVWVLAACEDVYGDCDAMQATAHVINTAMPDLLPYVELYVVPVNITVGQGTPLDSSTGEYLPIPSIEAALDAQLALAKQAGEPVLAVIGVSTSTAASKLMSWTNRTQVPLISADAASSTLSSASVNPYFLRTSTDSGFIARAVSQVLMVAARQEMPQNLLSDASILVDVVYQNDDVFSVDFTTKTLTSLQDAAISTVVPTWWQLTQCTDSTSTKVSPATNATLLRMLAERSTSSRSNVLLVSGVKTCVLAIADALAVLQEHLGLQHLPYQLVTVSPAAAALNRSSLNHGLHGGLTVLTGVPDTHAPMWSAVTAQLPPVAFASLTARQLIAKYIDAMMLAARATDTIFRAGVVADNSKLSGPLLLSAMRGTSFVGVSGPVQFSAGSNDRVGINSAITNIRRTGAMMVGSVVGEDAIINRGIELPASVVLHRQPASARLLVLPQLDPRLALQFPGRSLQQLNSSERATSRAYSDLALTLAALRRIPSQSEIPLHVTVRALSAAEAQNNSAPAALAWDMLRAEEAQLLAWENAGQAGTPPSWTMAVAGPGFTTPGQLIANKLAELSVNPAMFVTRGETGMQLGPAMDELQVARVMQLCPNNMQQSQAITRALRKFNWQFAGIIGTGDDDYSTGLQATMRSAMDLEGLVTKPGTPVLLSAAMLNEAADAVESMSGAAMLDDARVATLAAALQPARASGTRLFIVLLQENHAAAVLAAAASIGMVGDGWVWLFSDAATLHHPPSFQRVPANRTHPHISAALGALAVRPAPVQGSLAVRELLLQLHGAADAVRNLSFSGLLAEPMPDGGVSLRWQGSPHALQLWPSAGVSGTLLLHGLRAWASALRAWQPSIAAEPDWPDLLAAGLTGFSTLLPDAVYQLESSLQYVSRAGNSALSLTSANWLDEFMRSSSLGDLSSSGSITLNLASQLRLDVGWSLLNLRSLGVVSTGYGDLNEVGHMASSRQPYSAVCGLGQQMTFTATGSAVCANCPADTYSDEQSDSKCTRCPIITGDSLNTRTTTDGREGASAAADCTCPVGYMVRQGHSLPLADGVACSWQSSPAAAAQHLPAALRVSAAASVSSGAIARCPVPPATAIAPAASCQTCPLQAARCWYANTTVEAMDLRPGYFRAHSGACAAVVCPISGTCTGGLSSVWLAPGCGANVPEGGGTVPAADRDRLVAALQPDASDAARMHMSMSVAWEFEGQLWTNPSCAANAAGPMCASCAADYSRGLLTGECGHCASVWLLLLIMLASGAAFVLIVLYMTSTARVTKAASMRKAIAQKTLTEYVSLLSLVLTVVAARFHALTSHTAQLLAERFSQLDGPPPEPVSPLVAPAAWDSAANSTGSAAVALPADQAAGLEESIRGFMDVSSVLAAGDSMSSMSCLFGASEGPVHMHIALFITSAVLGILGLTGLLVTMAGSYWTTKRSQAPAIPGMPRQLAERMHSCFRHARTEQLIMGIATGLFLVTPTFTSMSYEANVCVSIPDGQGRELRVLAAEPALSCTSSHYWTLYGWSMAVFWLLVLGVPVGFGLLFMGARKRLHLPDLLSLQQHLDELRGLSRSLHDLQAAAARRSVDGMIKAAVRDPDSRAVLQHAQRTHPSQVRAELAECIHQLHVSNSAELSAYWLFLPVFQASVARTHILQRTADLGSVAAAARSDALLPDCAPTAVQAAAALPPFAKFALMLGLHPPEPVEAGPGAGRLQWTPLWDEAACVESASLLQRASKKIARVLSKALSTPRADAAPAATAGVLLPAPAKAVVAEQRPLTARMPPAKAAARTLLLLAVARTTAGLKALSPWLQASVEDRREAVTAVFLLDSMVAAQLARESVSSSLTTVRQAALRALGTYAGSRRKSGRLSGLMRKSFTASAQRDLGIAGSSIPENGEGPEQDKAAAAQVDKEAHLALVWEFDHLCATAELLVNAEPGELAAAEKLVGTEVTIATGMQQRLGFLYQTFTAKRTAWQTVIALQKIAIAAVTQLFAGTSAQAENVDTAAVQRRTSANALYQVLIVMVLLAISAVLTARFQPFVNVSDLAKQNAPIIRKLHSAGDASEKDSAAAAERAAQISRKTRDLEARNAPGILAWLWRLLAKTARGFHRVTWRVAADPNRANVVGLIVPFVSLAAMVGAVEMVAVARSSEGITAAADLLTTPIWAQVIIIVAIALNSFTMFVLALPVLIDAKLGEKIAAAALFAGAILAQMKSMICSCCSGSRSSTSAGSAGAHVISSNHVSANPLTAGNM